MWTMEITGIYSNVIIRCIFDTREEAEMEREKLAPLLGKDRYEFGKNGDAKTHRIIDKVGTVDVVLHEIKAVRVYDLDIWEQESLARQIGNKLKEKAAGL